LLWFDSSFGSPCEVDIGRADNADFRIRSSAAAAVVRTSGCTIRPELEAVE
jgi:hypothetical protein